MRRDPVSGAPPSVFSDVPPPETPAPVPPPAADGDPDAPRRIRYMSLRDLKPAHENPRNHAIDAIKTAFREMGCTVFGILDDRTGRIVAGHGRRETALEMLADGEPPPGGILLRQGPDLVADWLVPIAVGWASRDDDEADAMLLADNNLPGYGGWHQPGLDRMIAALAENRPALLPATGFTAPDLDELAAGLNPPSVATFETPAPLDEHVAYARGGGAGELRGRRVSVAEHRPLSTRTKAASRPPAPACGRCGWSDGDEPNDDTARA